MKLKWLAIIGIVLGLLAVACSAPGTNPEGDSGQEGGDQTESTLAQQQVKTTSDAECNVQPPDVTLENATVGFSQPERLNNPFRIEETRSIEDTAQQRGIDLISTNAQSSASKQLSDVQDMLAQGADVLIIAPLLEEGLEPALNSANEQGVPVFLIDRETSGKPCEDYITFMGSNFVVQGEQAANKLIDLTGGEAKIAELRGVPGASVTKDRGEGFRNGIKDESGMEIVASQTANFVRSEGQQVMEQLLQSNPDIDAVYAHNDEMAIGAIQAIKAAGKNPGQDVKIVSVDGTEAATQAIIDGDLNATITTNPRFGPLAFDTIENFLAGEPIPRKIIVQDQVIDESNAKKYLDTGAY